MQPDDTDELLLDTRRLAERIEAHAATGHELLARECVRAAGGLLSFEGPGSYLNKACGFPPGGRFTAADAEVIETFFVTRGVEPRVEIAPHVDASLLEHLARRGFVLAELETRLVRVLPPDEDLRAALPHGWPPGLTLERVDPEDLDAVELYARVVGEGFVDPGEPVTDGLLAFSRSVAAQRSSDCFLARLDSRAVGGGACDSRDGIGALFGASVVHDARGRGIQQALMVVRMERAREKGASIATIACSPGIATERNAARLGFRVAYTSVALVKHVPGLAPSM